MKMIYGLCIYLHCFECKILFISYSYHQSNAVAVHPTDCSESLSTHAFAFRSTPFATMASLLSIQQYFRIRRLSPYFRANIYINNLMCFLFRVMLLINRGNKENCKSKNTSTETQNIFGTLHFTDKIKV